MAYCIASLPCLPLRHGSGSFSAFAQPFCCRLYSAATDQSNSCSRIRSLSKHSAIALQRHIFGGLCVRNLRSGIMEVHIRNTESAVGQRFWSSKASSASGTSSAGSAADSSGIKRHWTTRSYDPRIMRLHWSVQSHFSSQGIRTCSFG